MESKDYTVTSKKKDKIAAAYQAMLEDPQVLINDFSAVPGEKILVEDYVTAATNLKNYVVLDNMIASGEATFYSDKKMPVDAFRLLMVSISQVQRDDKSFRTLFVPYKELGKIYKIDPRNISRHANEIRDSIESTKLRFSYEDKKGVKELSLAFVGMIVVSDEERGFYIRLNDSIAPFFLQLQDSFTRLEQYILAQLSTVPSMQILLLIKQKLMNDWPSGNNVSIVEISISQLRTATGCENTYKNNRDFINNVIDPFIENIARIPGWLDIKYEIIRNGRKMTDIQFTLQAKSRLEYIRTNGIEQSEFLAKKAQVLSKWSKLSQGEKASWADFEEYVAFHLYNDTSLDLPELEKNAI